MTDTKKQIAFRPDPKLYERLEKHKEATDAPFNRTLERALDAYLSAWEAEEEAKKTGRSKGAHVPPTGRRGRR